MLRLWLLTSVVASILLSVCSGLAVAIGNMIPPRPMQGFVDCVYECYLAFGFDVDDKKVIETITAYGYQYVSTHAERFSPGDFGFAIYLFTSKEQCDVRVAISGHYGTLSSITFTNCNLRVGDLLLLFGDLSSVYGDKVGFHPIYLCHAANYG